MESYNLLIPKDLKLSFQKKMLEEGKSAAEVIRQLMSDYLAKNIKKAA